MAKEGDQPLHAIHTSPRRYQREDARHEVHKRAWGIALVPPAFPQLVAIRGEVQRRWDEMSYQCQQNNETLVPTTTGMWVARRVKKAQRGDEHAIDEIGGANAKKSSCCTPPFFAHTYRPVPRITSVG